MTSNPRPLFYTCFILLLCFVKKLMAISGNETDLLSLIDIRDSIEGLGAWNQSLHFCQWQGITCGKRHRRVVVLFLPSLSLSGRLSPSIGNLSFLRIMSLAENKFYGEIPQEIGRLSRLQFLNISFNSFEGQIPVNLSQCTNLTVINFLKNDLTGNLPPKLGYLSKLKFLALDNNNLAGEIPLSFGNLSSLEIFSLKYNNFEGNIPDIFGKLERLKFLTFGVNRFSGPIPASIYNITSLEVLELVSNHLTGNLQKTIFITLPNLRHFFVGVNQFSGPLPTSFANASNLQIIDTDSNSLSGDVPTNLGIKGKLITISFENNFLGRGQAGDLNFISSLTNSTNLKAMYLGINNFGGVLPNSLANLSTHLESLGLRKNKISGTIPEWIGNLFGLTMLALHKNHFHGSMPSSIGNLRGLNQLFLAGNSLSGSIPYSFGNLSQLYLLSLYDNKLHGMIPSSLQACHRLQILELSDNNLSGNIHEKIISIPYLTTVDLSNNALSGSIPTSVGNLKNLQKFSLSRNKLSGEIPIELGNCESLEYLSMHHNQFEGPLPESLGSLRGLQLFDVSSNILSGQIPKSLENLPYLVWLNLSSNELEGEVPRKGVFGNDSSVISVTGNSKLCGGLPKLRLPRCQVQVSKHQGRISSLKVAAAIVSGAFFFILVVASSILCWRRRLKVKDSSSLLKSNEHLYVSYRDIFQATGGFSPENLIGSGGFGRVYKGILTHEEIEVAIKVFDLHEKGGLKSFMSECESLRNIRHRNLVKILTSCSSADFEGNDFKALIFELMPNGSLEDWLHQLVNDQSKKLSLLQRLNVAIDVASALSYLHHECHVSVVHCDLKPSNILLDNDMVAHVCDFGLASISESMESFHMTQSSFAGLNGSVGYIAPEYGLGGKASTYGDVYSFGILMLEMCTGRRPTNDLFEDDMNLHIHASNALPVEVLKIVDPILLSDNDETHEGTTDSVNQCYKGTKVLACLTDIIRIGVACSIESPATERLDIRDVVRQLHAVRDSFSGKRVFG